MYSNFITPPDLVQSILIVDADKEQIESCARLCANSESAYNIYLYNTDMNNTHWLGQVVDRVDTVLIQEDSAAPILNYIKFGPNQVLKQPADYFAK
jgi:hypothetical protein